MSRKHVAAAAAVLVALTSAAFADQTDPLAPFVALACSHQALVVSILAVFGGASVLQNLRPLLLKSAKTAWLVPLLDVAAANVWTFMLKSAPAAKVLVVIGLISALGACSAFNSAVSRAGKVFHDVFTGAPAATLTADQAAFVTEVKAYQTDFDTKATTVGIDALTLGRSACGFASELNGLYVSPIGQALVATGASAAGAASPAAVTGLDVTEAATFLGVQSGCSTLTAADPTTPAATVAAAAAAVLAAVPTLQAQLAQKVPPIAAALSAPAKAAGTP